MAPEQGQKGGALSGVSLECSPSLSADLYHEVTRYVYLFVCLFLVALGLYVFLKKPRNGADLIIKFPGGFSMVPHLCMKPFSAYPKGSISISLASHTLRPSSAHLTSLPSFEKSKVM